MPQEETQNEFSDDRDDRKTIYGLPNQNQMRVNKSMIWIPLVVGLSIAAGIVTTRAIQKLARGASPKTVSKATHNASSTTTSSTTSTTSTTASEASSGPSYEIPASAESNFSAKTFTGFVPYSGDFKEPMDVGEAALILGCRETSSKDILNKRFNTLMKCNHPDKGGSPFIASKINEAKTVLMKGK